jgi:hypothetical protein
MYSQLIFYNRARKHNGERKPSSVTGVRKMDIHMQKNKI